MGKTFKKPKVNIAPELAFISPETIAKVDSGRAGEKPQQPSPPPGMKLNPQYVEVRNKRVQLVMQPSLYERMKKATESEGISINEFCHRAIEAALTKGE